MCAISGYSDVGRVQMVAKHVKTLDEKLTKAEDDVERLTREKFCLVEIPQSTPKLMKFVKLYSLSRVVE